MMIQEKAEKNMGKIYIIPASDRMEASQAFSEREGAGFEYNDFFSPAMLDDRKRQIERINAYAKVRNDFSEDTMHGAFLDVTLHSDDARIREVSELRVRQSMEIAKEMGVRGIVFHSGKLYNFQDKKYLSNWMERNERFWRKMLELFPEQEIWMENMFDESPEPMAKLAENMKDCPGFGICLDYAHAIIYGGNPEIWLQRLSPYIRHMHINDNDTKSDLHQAIGEGKIDWKRFDGLIKRYQVEASLLVEVSGEKSQEKSLEYMKRHTIYPY